MQKIKRRIKEKYTNTKLSTLLSTKNLNSHLNAKTDKMEKARKIRACER